MKKELISFPYDGVRRHPRMAASARAAQFAPFSALNGYEEAIAETGRQTGEMRELHEDTLREVQAKAAFLSSRLAEVPEVEFVYFEEDPRKPGGEYKRTSGRLRAVDPDRRLFLLTDHRAVPMDAVVSLESPLLDDYDF